MEKVYDPKSVEEKWYKFWEEKGYFKPEIEARGERREVGKSEPLTTNSKPFTIVIPPPNVTGSLHMGHALNNTLQDIIIRKKRMEGFAALWLPGTDHAGIATQNVVEQEIAKEGKTRHDLGREKFIERVWQWKETYGNTIINQLKRLGCSCDWSRLRFTMDDDYADAVKEVFVRLYDEGLIYRGNYITNCCPRCLTALSDIEVEHDTVQGKLWHIKYPYEDGKGFIIVATTRPETMLGDTAVAVNPKDKKYKDAIGKTVILPLLNRKIKVIADELVDTDFGTGAVKVTPAHDPNDFEIAQRHDLEKINIFTDEAIVNENGRQYEGLERYEAREKVVEDLEAQGLIGKIEKHEHAVGHCYRCETVIEPRLSLQWFVKMKPLAQPAIEVVEKGKVNFVPERWTKIYFEWMDNIRDWCISRQIWWGHQIPVYYCNQEKPKTQNPRVKDACNEIIVSKEKPEKCPKCGNSNLIQEDDVLDTWFSSALWPFATLGWPKETPDLKDFYPTSVLSTSFDILYFWVARMIISGLHFMGDIPFDDVYIHALIRDAEGKKMSKSRGNVIDPIDDIEKYGTDALRFTLASLAVPGRDVFLSEERIEGNRNFMNKIWNAARFIEANIEKNENLEINKKELELSDKWILSKLQDLIKITDEHLKNYDFAKAAKALHDFFWSNFADWHIELAKPRIYNKEDKTVKAVLVKVLDEFCRLAHPFIPFISEEVWQMLPHQGESVMIADYPNAEKEYVDTDSVNKMQVIIDLITAVRTVRSELNVKPSQEIEVHLKTGDKRIIEIIKNQSNYICILVKSKKLIIKTDTKRPEGSAMTVVKGIEAYIPIKGLVNIKAEEKRAKKELDISLGKLDKVKNKLSNKQFTEKAPVEIVLKERNKEKELVERKEKLTEQIKILSEIK